MTGGAVHTVVFADIAGSTALFEAVGNARATAAVTQLTDWIGETVTTHGGRVVKTLGDGVLGVFEDGAAGVAAMAAMMRSHHHRMHAWPRELRLDLRAGLASGEIVQVDGDCYGDAVNVAARLSERAGPREIWATESTVEQAGAVDGTWFVRLGAMDLRGRSEPIVMYQVEWRDGEEGDSVTMQAALPSAVMPLDSGSACLELSWGGAHRAFLSTQTPVHLGRATQAQVHVGDPRVSRLHARIDWRNGTFVLTDLSSFGTWVHFGGGSTVVNLRRDACLLHGTGVIALGVPLGKVAGGPTVGFRVSGGTVLPH
ncbi:adenylate/guanylate cyclase domain-containing protein [Acidovorax sp. SUPP950]|uniref:adenylate/guanylate cyclase domain-containing protein n=1 Tax=unclassified Acidovorax TaxID=2684926 RepID=UPI0023BB7F67|nr:MULTISPECIES: adenylate/guanylate cyclase domain-containing protein [Comamonadaceae]WOI44718.1 adenylate/guanylate cyclase domain-containing protein [Paracidovorax avenae]GKS77318.1 adenylate/guanylate cyclase domain-containing protein [Acidovorax sp. SUPP950]